MQKKKETKKMQVSKQKISSPSKFQKINLDSQRQNLKEQEAKLQRQLKECSLLISLQIIAEYKKQANQYLQTLFIECSEKFKKMLEEELKRQEVIKMQKLAALSDQDKNKNKKLINESAKSQSPKAITPRKLGQNTMSKQIINHQNTTKKSNPQEQQKNKLETHSIKLNQIDSQQIKQKQQVKSPMKQINDQDEKEHILMIKPQHSPDLPNQQLNKILITFLQIFYYLTSEQKNQEQIKQNDEILAQQKLTNNKPSKGDIKSQKSKYNNPIYNNFSTSPIKKDKFFNQLEQSQNQKQKVRDQIKEELQNKKKQESSYQDSQSPEKQKSNQNQQNDESKKLKEKEKKEKQIKEQDKDKEEIQRVKEIEQKNKQLEDDVKKIKFEQEYQQAKEKFQNPKPSKEQSIQYIIFKNFEQVVPFMKQVKKNEFHYILYILIAIIFLKRYKTILDNKEKKLKQLYNDKKRQQEELELKECTFKPQTQANDRDHRKVDEFIVDQEKWYKNHQLKLQQLKQQYENEEQQNCTYHPIISPSAKSSRITEERVEDRLLETHLQHLEKMEKIRQSQLPSFKPETSHQQKIK